jgi:hypothetical protein
MNGVRIAMFTSVEDGVVVEGEPPSVPEELTPAGTVAVVPKVSSPGSVDGSSLMGLDASTCPMGNEPRAEVPPFTPLPDVELGAPFDDDLPRSVAANDFSPCASIREWC